MVEPFLRNQRNSIYIFYIYIYKWAYRYLFVCLSVGMWRANRNPNPCTDLDEILHTHPNLSKEGFGPGLKP